MTPFAPDAWQTLGAYDPKRLAEARLQAHHAVQWVPRLVRANLPLEPGHAHLSLAWDPELGGLYGRPVPAAAGPVRAGLRFADLSLVLAGADGAALAALALHGRTTGEVEAWLAVEGARLGLKPPSPPFRYDLPPHPVATGGRFAVADAWDALLELARYFADAALILGDLAASVTGAGPVRCWAHHFDTAVLVAIDAVGGADARLVGVGFSPGDDHHPQPYFYAYPWPYPEPNALPPLPAPAFWNTEGFLGAVLLADDIVPLADQETAVRALVDRMLAACRSALAPAASAESAGRLSHSAPLSPS